MNKQIEALKMAIEGMAKSEKVFDDLGLLLIKFGVNPSDINFHKESFLAPAIQACKEALAETEKQEPVAWMEEYQSCKVNGDERLCHSDKVFRLVQLLASQSKEWQSLSDDEIASVIKTTFPVNVAVTNVDLKFARAIEQALKEKND